MDSLSQFIEHLAPKCEVFAHVQLRAPWGIAESQLTGCCFSYVHSGRCLLEINNQSPLWLEQGSLLLLPYGSPHRLMSEQDVTCQDAHSLFVGKTRQELEEITIGGQGAASSVICGVLSFAPFMHWAGSSLLGGLPEVIVIPAQGQPRVAQLLAWLYQENAQSGAGSQAASQRLLDLLLLEVLRYLDQQTLQPGWLLAVQDRYLAPVLMAIQQQPQDDWTVESLAQYSGLARSAFAQRFKQLTESTPLQFVQQWRCLLAAQLLVTGDNGVKQIAHQCGFQSSDVFIRNFRKFHGTTPKQYRLQFKALAPEYS